MSELKNLLEEDKENVENMAFLARRKKMTAREKHQLGPIEKYRDYGILRATLGKFPWKLLFHILLVFLTTTQCLIMNRSTFSHTRAEIRYFYYWFVSDSIEFTAVDFNINRFIFTLDDLREQVKKSRDVRFPLPLELLRSRAKRHRRL